MAVSDLEIERVQVYAVGPDTERYTWALDHTEQFVTNTIVRITTRGGVEGIGGAMSVNEYGFTGAVAETMRHMLPKLVGAAVSDREALWPVVGMHDIPLAPQARSAIDIALWDAVAKYAGLPLYQLLGGARDRVLSYASTPLMQSAAAYVDLVGELKSQGFTAIKFHCWCEIGRDLEMARAVHERFGDSDLRFMLDVEQRYTREQALRAAEELSELGYAWFEAPLPDTDLEGYRELRRRVRVPIIPAGNTILDLKAIAQALRLGCWTSVRVDATIVGGITPGRKVMALAEAYGTNVELQSWGYTLGQAANLHLMLAYENCDYFEQPVPYQAFEYGSRNPIRTDADGYVHAPDGPGLGIVVDWDVIEAAAFLKLEESVRA